MFYYPSELGNEDCKINLSKAVTIIRKISEKSEVIGSELHTLGEFFFTLHTCILSIKRGGQDIQFTADCMLQAGDVVALMYNQSDYDRVFEIFGFSEEEILVGYEPLIYAGLKRSFAAA